MLDSEAATARCSAAFSGSRALRAPEEPRGERVEALDSPVAVGRRELGEAEVRGQDLNLGARAPKRSRELVVVPRRERRRICKHDTHRCLQ